MTDGDGPAGRDLVAIVLACGLALSLVLMVGAVFYDALRSDTPGLSENATQVVIAAFTGITGVLGGYIGGRAVEQARRRALDDEQRRHEPEQQPPDA